MTAINMNALLRKEEAQVCAGSACLYKYQNHHQTAEMLLVYYAPS
jgi:hypothetical protein